ncbi:MAG: hypothetical protein O2782_22645, partial [bacterium]|nr:hypothetical protein [bacterium]
RLYDTAVIDLGLPGLPGDLVAARMRQLDPSPATILMTGWRLEANDARLCPFDLRNVTALVAQAMALHDARAGPSGELSSRGCLRPRSRRPSPGAADPRHSASGLITTWVRCLRNTLGAQVVRQDST